MQQRNITCYLDQVIRLKNVLSIRMIRIVYDVQKVSFQIIKDVKLYTMI